MVCGICGQNGHNRRTCPQAQPRGDNARDNGGANARDNDGANDARNQDRNPSRIQEIRERYNLLRQQQWEIASRLISVVMRRGDNVVEHQPDPLYGMNRIDFDEQEVEQIIEESKLKEVIMESKKTPCCSEGISCCIIKNKKESDDDCAICLESVGAFNRVVTPCGHVFCFTCMDDYKGTTCPICRSTIRKRSKGTLRKIEHSQHRGVAGLIIPAHMVMTSLTVANGKKYYIVDSTTHDEIPRYF